MLSPERQSVASHSIIHPGQDIGRTFDCVGIMVTVNDGVFDGHDYVARAVSGRTFLFATSVTRAMEAAFLVLVLVVILGRSSVWGGAGTLLHGKDREFSVSVWYTWYFMLFRDNESAMSTGRELYRLTSFANTA